MDDMIMSIFATNGITESTHHRLERCCPLFVLWAISSNIHADTFYHRECCIAPWKFQSPEMTWKKTALRSVKNFSAIQSDFANIFLMHATIRPSHWSVYKDWQLFRAKISKIPASCSHFRSLYPPECINLPTMFPIPLYTQRDAANQYKYY